jgi:uncharacterized membrane protein YccC
VVAAQRLAGALIGAAAATLLMLIAASEHGLKLISIRHALEVVMIVFFVHGAAIRFWNYAFYTAAIAAGALLAVDLPDPSNYSAEGDRVLYTLIGVAIAVLVMLLGNLLAKLSAKAPPQAAPQPASVSGCSAPPVATQLAEQSTARSASTETSALRRPRLRVPVRAKRSRLAGAR